MLGRSTVVATVPSIDLPVFRAYGDIDDHLRLTTLVADCLGRGPDLEERRRACLSRNCSWSDRISAFSDILRIAAKHHPAGSIAVLADIDALDPGIRRQADLWDDRALRSQRSEFLQAILSAVDAGGWVVARTSTTSRLISEQLAETAAAPPVAPKAQEFVSPDSQPITDWLLRRNVMSERDLARSVEAATDDVDDHVISVAYDCLDRQARATGRRLSALRPPQRANGAISVFRIDDDREDEATIPREGVQALQECGFLEVEDSDIVRMPRLVRRFLAAQARLVDGARVQEDHRLLAAAGSPDVLSDQLEAHYHAIEGADIEAALETTRYYGSDLRRLAFQLSQLQRFDRAAEIYQFILDEIDREDSYAWEYLAFNKAMALRRPRSEGDERDILLAYKRAAELDSSNPLYRGRLIGFRAEIGENIERDFSRSMAEFSLPSAPSEAVSYFAEAVLLGLQRGSQEEQRRTIVEKWGVELRRHPRLAQFV
jgi:tetratricopeptide (TPR) repeat protein